MSQRIRVPAGFLCAALFLVFARPTPILTIAGFVVSLVGVAIRAWAAGCIEKSRELEVRGPYRYTRNPLYLGSFVAAAGCLVAAGQAWLVVIFLALFALIYGPVMRREEEEMKKLFPGTFPAYQSSVPLFLPRFPAHRNAPRAFATGSRDASPLGSPASRERRFRWSRFLRNKEHRAWLGFGSAFAWLCLRLWLD
jgi:hypothetical protein